MPSESKRATCSPRGTARLRYHSRWCMSKKARLALCYAAGSLGGRSGRPGSVAASAAVPGPSAGPALARPRLAHVDLATGEVPAVQRRDRLVGLARRGHLDEAEAARATRVAVRDDRRRFARPVFREERFEVRTGGVEREVSDEELLAHGILLPRCGAPVILSRLPERDAEIVGKATERIAHKQADRTLIRSCRARCKPYANAGRGATGSASRTSRRTTVANCPQSVPVLYGRP